MFIFLFSIHFSYPAYSRRNVRNKTSKNRAYFDHNEARLHCKPVPIKQIQGRIFEKQTPTTLKNQRHSVIAVAVYIRKMSEIVHSNTGDKWMKTLWRNIDSFNKFDNDNSWNDGIAWNTYNCPIWCINVRAHTDDGRMCYISLHTQLWSYIKKCLDLPEVHLFLWRFLGVDSNKFYCGLLKCQIKMIS